MHLRVEIGNQFIEIETADLTDAARNLYTMGKFLQEIPDLDRLVGVFDENIVPGTGEPVKTGRVHPVRRN